ncbi:hypothetical protein [Polaromonas sp. JS666]|uniref:hypothetical protein n=1 Tax=Polaromonas sp. (strain JS666 / ATCC BAA-500) TaxID=296591 RepID=UPI0009422873|nr:hypothetical protein [Polaromonas sp. JS666]
MPPSRPLSRLYQPRNPLFWLMLTLNGLSPLLAWVVHNHPLTAWATLLLTGFALGNAILGTFLLWRLLRDEPAAPARDSGTRDDTLAS